jgi:hypothetical protein
VLGGTKGGENFSGWEEEDDNRDWLLVSLRDLRGFYADAAANGWAVITCLV